MSAVKARSRGVALIMVLTLVALVTGVVAEFLMSSSLDLNLALGARDEVQAELSALSVLRMRALLLKQQSKFRPVVAAAMGGLGGGGGGGGAAVPLGPILEQIPVTCGLLNAISRTASEQAWDGDFFPGECEALSRSEHGKIAVNLLATSTQGNAKRIQDLLGQVLSNPALRPLFETNDRTGQHAESPAALVAHINDWIDSDHNELGGFGDEDRYYQYQRDPYRAKNAPMDSVAELRLVHGVNDLVYEMLANNITVHNGSAKLELGTASEQMVVMALMGAVVPGAAIEQAFAAMPAVLTLVRQAKMSGASATVGLLQSALAAAGAKSLFDDKAIKTIFADSDESTWYTIEAEGNLGRAARRIKVVFQASEGQFYYARID